MTLLTAVLCVLLVSGFAAGGQAPDAALDQLRTFTYGQSRGPLFAIETHIRRVANDPKRLRELAARLAAILDSPKTPFAAQQFIGQQLGRIGTDAQVPALAKLLLDARTSGIARRALQTIPGDAAGKALRESLAVLRGDARLGVVNALGERRDAKAAEVLGKLLLSPDLAGSAAAARALGKIGTAEAAAALAKSKEHARPDLREAICRAQLRCAERLKPGPAAAIYEQFLATRLPSGLRIAALTGLVKLRGAEAAPLLIKAMRSDEPAVRGTAVRLARDVPGEGVTRALVAELRKAPPATQVLLLGTLADRADGAALPAVTALADGKDERVRLAAIRALGRLGDQASVAVLLRVAATAPGAARASLAKLSGQGVDAAIAAAAAKGKAAERLEAIGALAARGAAGAAPVLVQAVSDGDQRVRIAAWKALGILGGAEQYGDLVKLLVAAPTLADMQAAGRVVMKVGAKVDPLAARVGPILAAMKTAPADRRPPLLRILGRYRGPEALKILRAARSDPNPETRDVAVRALAEWPGDEVAADLLAIASGAKSPTHRVLAIRGYLRLAQANRQRPAPDTLKMLSAAMPLLKTAQQKRTTLAILSAVADPAALTLALRFLGDKDARAEAELAVLRIAEATLGTDADAVAAAMQKLLDAKPGKTVAAQARLILRRTKGFVPLFDGKTTKGWIKPFDWGEAIVKDGAIHLQGNKKFFLVTEKTYGDFILELEAHLDEGANSGIQFRSHFERNRLWGYQADVDSLPRGWRGIYDETPGRGWLSRGDAKKAEKLYRKTWNKYRVECIGTHMRFFMNGELIVDHVDPLEIDGHIALQHHGEKGKVVRFRNIRTNDLGRRRWLPLLDPKTLSKWQPNGLGKWTVEDGAIVGRRSGGGGHGMLFSDREHADFAVRFQYKVLVGNCGFYLRSEKLKGHQGARGLQVEIDPAKDNSGLYETHGREWVAKPSTDKFYKRGQWNDVAVFAQGRRVVVHLNAHKTVELLNDPGRTKGHFALGLHNGNVHVLFKNIEILSDPEP